MKKVLLLTVCLLLVVAGTAFASEGNITPTTAQSDTVLLYAEVLPYASVSWLPNATTLVFSGAANETQSGTVNCTIESNCNIYTELTGTAFTNGGFSLFTQWQHPINGWWHVPGDLCIPAISNSMGIQNVPVNYQATTGPTISSQAAGLYTGSLTMTVYQW